MHKFTKTGFLQSIYACIWLILLFLLPLSCTHDEADPVLSEGEALIEQDPLKAVAYFDSIAQAGKGRDALFDLLSLKARDKAYVTHTSDSVIKEVLAYYEGHKDNPRYPEALYYAGRVYADMGDSPTALRYFQEAHSVLSDAKTKNNLLMACVISQLGRLLASLSLYEESINYCQESIRFDSLCNDTLNLLYDLRLKGEIYTNMENYEAAEYCYNRGKGLASAISSQEMNTQNLYCATALFNKGENTKALELIRTVIDSIDPDYRSVALTYASKIYYRAEKYDSVYLYARELASEANYHNRATGYHMLLLPRMRGWVPIDTLYSYMYKYRDMVDYWMDNRQTQAFMLQNSLYNYTLHEKAKIVALNRNITLRNWLILALTIGFLLIIGLLILRNHTTHIKLELLEAIKAIDQLKQELSQSHDYGVTDPNNNRAHLRQLLREKLYALQDNKDIPETPPESITESDAYKDLRNCLNKDIILEEDDKLWDRLEGIVMKASPKFRKRLELLTGDHLTPTDLHMALLIKCGLTPTEMGKLVGRTKGTISGRRATLCQKVFDDKKGVHVIDNIIRLL